MDDAARNELHAELQPWMLELKSHATRISPNGSEMPHLFPQRSEMLWVCVDLRSSGGELKHFESLELLALAGGLDDQLWFRLINEAMPRGSQQMYKRHARPIGLELNLHVASADAVLTVCERLVVGGIEAVVPSKYQTLRTRLERLYAAQEEAVANGRASTKCGRAQLVIPVKLASSNLNVEIRLPQLAHVASMQSLRDTSYSPVFSRDTWRPLFRVVSIDPSTSSSLSAKTMLYLGQISACGIDIKLREDVEQLALHDEARPLVARTLQALFATVSGTSTATRKQGTVSSVKVSSTIKPSTAACIFSGLGRSQSVSSFTLGPFLSSTGNRNERDHLWAWIGFSIFGPHASHAIEEIRIDADDLSQEDVAACLNAMEVTGGLTMLRENGDVHPPWVQQEVIASRFCLTRPTDSTDTPTVQLASQRVWLLLQDSQSSDGWVKVVLPGCGLAWVRHDDVEVPPPIARSSPCIGLELFDITGHSIHPAQALVCGIGSTLSRLDASGFQCEQRIDDWLRTVLASCPQLEVLQLYDTTSGITSMAIFSDAYDRGTCRVENLSLRDVSVEDRDSMAQFFNVLSDNDRAMTKHLRSFTYSFHEQTTPFPNIVPAMEAALEANRMLERIEIMMEYGADAQPEDGDAMGQLHEHDGEVLRMPLALTSKLAFLSVVLGNHQASTAGASSSVHDLDSPVVALIFAFAATIKVRHAAFWLCSTDRR